MSSDHVKGAVGVKPTVKRRRERNLREARRERRDVAKRKEKE